MNVKILKSIADQLDSLKEYALADRLDSILRRFADNSDLIPTEENNLSEDWDVSKEEEALQNPTLENPLDKLPENETYKNKYFSSLNKTDLYLLKKYQMHLITSGEEFTPNLGTGAYGRVYSIVCGLPSCQDQGEVAVKITNLKEQEGQKWKAIKEISKSLPANLAKHTPKIYDIINDDETEMQLIVMEKLTPLNRKLKNLLFRYPSGELPLKKFMKDEELVYSFLKGFINNFMDLDEHTISKIYKGFLNFKINSEDKYVDPNEFTRLRSHLENVIQNIIAQETNISIISKLDDLLTRIENHFLIRFYDALEYGRFPRNYYGYDEDNSVLYDHLPESKSLLNFLKALKGKGVSWNDLHDLNLMIRPSTGDLVIVDVGLYDF